uniref:Uncharacterized protein n=1 Tax=Trypanosoma congolense (strain IL3000) TaxID=1068625 RepID=G0UKT7_TRYCI|nr:hypothetical protein, unlikely [Trypanosoma congolense IL3000]
MMVVAFCILLDQFYSLTFTKDTYQLSNLPLSFDFYFLCGIVIFLHARRCILCLYTYWVGGYALLGGGNETDLCHSSRKTYLATFAEFHFIRCFPVKMFLKDTNP